MTKRERIIFDQHEVIERLCSAVNALANRSGLHPRQPADCFCGESDGRRLELGDSDYTFSEEILELAERVLREAPLPR